MLAYFVDLNLWPLAITVLVRSNGDLKWRGVF